MKKSAAVTDLTRVLKRGRLYPLGSQDRPLRVAIVGSGPSSFYAALALFKQKGLKAEVDIYDRLPTPYGLVRFGVAPDHQSIKGVTRVYEKIAFSERLRFFGNVQVGQDISVTELEKHYDQIVYATGSETDRRLGIPGEDMEGSYTATEFVGWYNSHPDYCHRSFQLSSERVAVVGVGNVAMDVTRILVKNPDQLSPTDIADKALKVLCQSRVREVILLARRGPAQVAFSPREIREIGNLEGVDLVVDSQEMELDTASKGSLKKEDIQNVVYLREKSREGEGRHSRKVRLRFCVSPVEILGQHGCVRAVKIEQNELYRDERGRIRPRGTGRYQVLPVGLIFRSVGYRGLPLPGVPFDEKRGLICNREGRVTDASSGLVVPNQYVVGWIKRGPTGLIGTNKGDSAETVKRMVEDIGGRSAPVNPDKTPGAVDRLFATKELRVVSFEDWKLLDQREVEEGERFGKIRQKLATVPEMLEAIEERKAIAQRKDFSRRGVLSR